MGAARCCFHFGSERLPCEARAEALYLRSSGWRVNTGRCRATSRLLDGARPPEDARRLATPRLLDGARPPEDARRLCLANSNQPETWMNSLLYSSVQAISSCSAGRGPDAISAGLLSAPSSSARVLGQPM